VKIVQISDIHLTEPESRGIAHSPATRLRKAIALVNDRHPDADLCVITGDLVDDGARESYASLLTVLDSLKADYRLLLGNHDRRASFRSVFPQAPVDPGGYVQSGKELGEAQLIFLDTLNEGEDGGLLCEGRLGWLRDQLAATPNKQPGGGPAFVFMHHPPVDIGLPALDDIGLKDRQAFWELIRSSGRECVVFCGHVHRNASVCVNGTNVHFSRGLHRRIALSSTQTVMALEDAPPAFSVIEMSKSGEIRVVVEEFTD
jgi:3',5'-cyclic AMP phosphodiesterase CpdA